MCRGKTWLHGNRPAKLRFSLFEPFGGPLVEPVPALEVRIIRFGAHNDAISCNAGLGDQPSFLPRGEGDAKLSDDPSRHVAVERLQVAHGHLIGMRPKLALLRYRAHE